MVLIKTFFIKEDDKLNRVKKVLNLIKVKGDGIIVPQNLSPKNTMKVVKKIVKSCKKEDVKNIVLSKALYTNKILINEITSHNITIFDGRWLLNFMVYEVIDYLLKNTNKKREETEITILTNSLTDKPIRNIELLSKDFKRVNIVTNHINKFKYLEKKIYDEYGMMITVTNNKRKSLLKSEIIVNFDFSQELLNRFNIYEEAIIINVEGNIKINQKRFNGTNINDYEITSVRVDEFFEHDKLENFYLRDLLEAELYRKDSFKNIRKDIIAKHYRIKALYGKNGKIF